MRPPPPPPPAPPKKPERCACGIFICIPHVHSEKVPVEHCECGMSFKNIPHQHLGLARPKKETSS